MALNVTITTHSNQLAAEIEFLPLKPFVTGAELIVAQKSGLGRWKVPISFFAIEGEVDGTTLCFYPSLY